MADISWNWLAPRFSPRELLSTNRAVARRPCLPAMEPLDDRVLLSIAPGATAGGVLVDVIKGEVAGRDSLFATELAVLKTMASLSTQNKVGMFTATGSHIHKATLTMMKISDTFFKFSADLIKGELTANKDNKLLTELNNDFLKLDGIVQEFGSGEENPLLSEVQSLKEQATMLFTDLSKVELVGEIPLKEQQLLYKISQDFMLTENTLLKTAEDAVLGKETGAGTQKYFEVKMEQVLVSSAMLSDQNVAGQLQALATGVLDLAARLGQSGGGTTGVTLANNTGDVITNLT